MREDMKSDVPVHVRVGTIATSCITILPNPGRGTDDERSKNPLPNAERHAATVARMKVAVAAASW